MDEVKIDAANRAIFRGDFDHWGGVTVRSGPIVECGVDECDHNERVGDLEGPFGSRDPYVIGYFAFELHLSHSHLDDVINALEDNS